MNTDEESSSQRRIVIVGVCGSGKSVLAEALRRRGYQAESVAQEHSMVPDLFLHPHPDIIIYLEASDATVAERKETGWDHQQLELQRQRLGLARERAAIHLSTDGLSPAKLLARAEAELRKLF